MVTGLLKAIIDSPGIKNLALAIHQKNFGSGHGGKRIGQQKTCVGVNWKRHGKIDVMLFQLIGAHLFPNNTYKVNTLLFKLLD